MAWARNDRDSSVLVVLVICVLAWHYPGVYSQITPGHRPLNAIGWGYNGVGQLGRGYESMAGGPNFLQALTPSTRGVGEIGTVKSIYVANDYAVLLDQHGLMYAWGYNYGNRFGIKNHPLLSYGADFEANGDVITMRSPVLMQNAEGNLVPMKHLGATDAMPVAISVDVSGVNLWRRSSTTHDWISHTFSGVSDISDLVCSGDYCIFWENSRLTCIEPGNNPINVLTQCDNPPWQNNVAAAAIHGKIGDGFMALASNGTHIFMRHSPSWPTSGIPLLALCDPSVQWCQVNLTSDPINIKEIALCDYNSFFVRSSTGDVLGLLGSTFIHHSSRWPYLNASSISCSQKTLHFVNSSAVEGDTIFSHMIDPNVPRAALLARLWETGVAIDLSEPINIENVLLSTQKLQNVKLAKRTIDAMAVFATTEVAPSASTQTRRYNAVTWGDNSLGQAMWMGDTLVSMTPKAVALEAAWLPDFSLSESNCTMHGSLDFSLVHCHGTGHFLGGATFIGSPVSSFPPSSTESSMPFLVSTSEALIYAQGPRLSGYSKDNGILDFLVADMTFDIHHVRGGDDHVGFLDQYGFLYLYNGGFYGTSHSVNGYLFWNTTLKAHSTDVYSLGHRTTAIYVKETQRIYVMKDPNSQSYGAVPTVKKLVVSHNDMVWLQENGQVYEWRDLEQSSNPFINHTLVLQNCVDLAAMNRTFFAIADSPVGSESSKSIYVWGMLSNVGQAGNFDSFIKLILIPTIVPLPMAGMVPTKICDNCRGNTMIAFLEPYTVPAAVPPVPNQIDPFFAPNGPQLGSAQLNVSTCWGRNDWGQCGSDNTISTTQMAFSRKYQTPFKQLVSSSSRTYALSYSNELYTFAIQDLPRPYAPGNVFDPEVVGHLLGRAGSSKSAKPAWISSPPLRLIAANPTHGTFYYVTEAQPSVLRHVTTDSAQTVNLGQEIRDFIVMRYDTTVWVALFDVGFYVSGLSRLMTLNASADSLSSVVFGKNYTAAILRDGDIHWEINRDGTRNTFFGVVMIAGGKYHFAALTISQTVVTFAWTNEYGQAGVPSASFNHNGGPFALDLTNVRYIASAEYTTFALRSNGEIYSWGLYGHYELFGFQFDGYFSYLPVKSPFTLSPSVVHDTKILVSDATIHLIVPDTLSPPPFECPQPPPSGLSSDPICGPDGFWIIIGNVNTPSGDILLTSPVVIEGNVTIPASTTIQIPLGSLSGSGSFLKINGCASIDGSINVTLNAEDLELIEQQGGSIDVSLIEAKCGIVNGKVNAVGPKSCKKVSSSQTTSNDSEGGYTLGATFRVNSNGCRLWWIVLVSVVGGLIVLAVVVILLATLTPLKHIIRPHAKRAEEANIYHFQDKKE